MHNCFMESYSSTCSTWFCISLALAWPGLAGHGQNHNTHTHPGYTVTLAHQESTAQPTQHTVYVYLQRHKLSWQQEWLSDCWVEKNKMCVSVVKAAAAWCQAWLRQQCHVCVAAPTSAAQGQGALLFLGQGTRHPPQPPPHSAHTRHWPGS